MTRPASILLVSPCAHYPSHNWPNTVALLRALRRKGNDASAITFCTPPDAAPPEFRDRIFPVFQQPPWRWRKRMQGRWTERRFAKAAAFYETWDCLRRAARLAGRDSDTVLHVVGGSYWAVALMVLWSKKCRVVSSLYGGILAGGKAGLKGWLQARARALLQRAVATGRLEFTCENDLLHAEMSSVLGTHIHVVPYAVDTETPLPSKAEARQRLKLPPTEKIMLFFGTHRREKDYRTALLGARTLSAPPLALFAGKVISANDPQRVAQECGYPNFRSADEFVPEADIPFYFAAADAVILPYEAEFARGSGVLIDCCCHRRPMVASATPYFSNFFERYPAGITYRAGDPAAFAVALNEVLNGGKNFDTGLETARRDHSWAMVAGQYLALYQRVRQK